ncbi:MAG TPA: response regulator, partial [Chloroflexota bacterium]|nr:response regulator [Chloroflexota bacterium]
MGQTRVVIADDESIIRMDLREMLTGLGYLVVGEAGDGLSVVNLARELRPDLVIMDIKMP